jgi:hypothetical protein
MSFKLLPPARFARCVAFVFAAGLLTTACGGAPRSGSPQSPSGTAALTGAKLGIHFQRVLVAEQGVVVMVARDGCVATVSESGGHSDGVGDRHDAADAEEMRVRCPRPERLKAWFSAVDRLVAGIALVPVSDDSSDDAPLPAAELVTGKGEILKVEKRADAERLLGEVRALSAELAAAEMPSPGPSSANGWQMLRVAGPAHVILGGNEAAGVLEARMSTNGQYLCDFVANTGGGPIRATKSGWISPVVAARAIDDVLSPLADVGGADRRPTTLASGIASGSERRANIASTGAVFLRFAHVQEALGDACLPELDPPTAQIGL